MAKERERTNHRRNAQPTRRVRRARIPTNLTYENMSQLGRDLYDLMLAAERAGETLKDEHELEREIARRRGGYVPED